MAETQYELVSLNRAMRLDLKLKSILPDLFKHIKVGFIVQLEIETRNLRKRCAERFWVLVRYKRGNVLKGEVNNVMGRTQYHGVKLGDIIEFGKDHIINVLMSQ